MSDVPLGGGFAPGLFARTELDQSASNLAGRSVAEWMKWQGVWQSGNVYKRFDVVTDVGWLMVCTTDAPLGTTERAAPIPTGAEFELYDGLAPTTSSLATQVLSGHRYTINAAGYLTAWRAYTTAGEHYSVYLVDDPEGAAEIFELLEFNAVTTGWSTNRIAPRFITAGRTFDLLVVASEPDETPITWEGTWYYDTPNNAGTPAVGVIQQSNAAPGELRVNYIDSDATDRTTELQALNVGDIVNGPGGTRWAISSAFDEGTWIRFGISPTTQTAPDGPFLFVFETVTPTDIVYMEDAAYWPTSPFAGQVEGVLKIGGDPLVRNDSAYGVDITVQYANIPDEWEVMAYTDSGGATPTARADLFASQNDLDVLRAWALDTFHLQGSGGGGPGGPAYLTNGET